MADSIPFPDVITEATNRLLLEQAKAEENAIAAALCDVLDDYDTSHNAALQPPCMRFFSDEPCDLDWMTVSQLRTYASVLRYRRA